MMQRYELQDKIGAGGFGSVYKAKDLFTGELVAVKLEPHSGKQQLLPYEARVYQQLQHCSVFPTLHYFGVEDGHNVLVIELLGQSLGNYVKRLGLPLPTEQINVLARKLIRVVQKLHDRGFVHRDLKPGNFVLGAPPRQRHLYLLDFGLSKCYWQHNTQQHIPFRDNKHWLGSARYSSVFAHQGLEASRRDDLQCVGFMLALFANGKLPWDGIAVPPKYKTDKNVRLQHLQAICAAKERAIEDGSLSRALPQLQTFLDNIQALQFDQRPDYKLLRTIFRHGSS